MQAIIMGAGPAGLTAAYSLARRGHASITLEAAEAVGGICRTITHEGYHFDLGGHRFFTKFDEVRDLWYEILGDDLLLRPRMSRIYYRGRFFDYPLKASNALTNLGVLESVRCTASYARARLRPRGTERNFEEWVSNRFGDRLFQIFFKTYTEKVWGIPCSSIGAEWASQRIKDMELSTVLRNTLLNTPLSKAFKSLGPNNETKQVSSLIEQFLYPRTGPGLMFDTLRDKAEALGARILTQHRVTRLEHDGQRVLAARVPGPDGSQDEQRFEGSHFLSSMPLTELVLSLDPPAPGSVRAAARALRFRNLITVDIIVDHPNLLPDTWIYVHDPTLRLGRIQVFKNWSPYMVPDQSRSSLGLEYFCFSDDPLWSMSNRDLLAMGTGEIRRTGLLRGAPVLGGTVVRVPGAYPVYEMGYRSHLDTIRSYLGRFRNLQAMGRGGMFKYNNADHSMLTALLAAENLYGAGHDIWRVNTDSSYHEIRRD